MLSYGCCSQSSTMSRYCWPSEVRSSNKVETGIAEAWYSWNGATDFPVDCFHRSSTHSYMVLFFQKTLGVLLISAHCVWPAHYVQYKPHPASRGLSNLWGTFQLPHFWARYTTYRRSPLSFVHYSILEGILEISLFICSRFGVSSCFHIHGEHGAHGLSGFCIKTKPCVSTAKWAGFK